MKLTPNEVSHAGSAKSARYGWAIVDDMGEMLMIDKELLHVDPAYQRDVADADAKVKRIASNWSWIACGALIVAQRDGKFYVVDGQHRARAAMKLSSVRRLPCIVFESEGTQSEAKAFLAANRERKPMKAVQAFKAMVEAGERDAVFVNDMLTSFGCRVVAGPSGIKGVQAPGTILMVAARDHAAARRVFSCALAACGDESVHSDIIKGLNYIDIADPTNLPKMSRRLATIGRAEILQSIARAKAFRGAGGEKICAEGIVNAYNHRLRTKMEI